MHEQIRYFRIKIAQAIKISVSKRSILIVSSLILIFTLMGTILSSPKPAIASTFPANNNWSIANGAAPQISSISQITCPTTDFCVAVTSLTSLLGSITTSVDGGNNWVIQTVPSTLSYIAGVDCPSTNFCVAVGQSVSNTGEVIYSTDEGVTWSVATLPGGIYALNGISCTSSSFCMAVGFQTNSGEVITSINGGVTWNADTIPTSAINPTGVSCVGTGFCEVIGSNSSGSFTMYTNNSGASWSQGGIPNPSDSLYSIQCITANDCLLTGSEFNQSSSAYSGMILQSTNFGVSWSALTIPASVTFVESISCIDANSCVATGATSNQIISIQTNNGGATWGINQFATNVNELLTVSCSSSTICIVGGDETNSGNSIGAIFRSNNFGGSWTPIPLEQGAGLLDSVSCTGPLFCVTVGAGGASGAVVQYSTNGGSTWSTSSVPAGINWLYAVNCPTSSLCIAGGYEYNSSTQQTSGVIIYSTDSAQTWSLATVPTNVGLIDGISCTGQTFCAAVGNTSNSTQSGLVLLSTTQGTSWTNSPLPAGTSSFSGVSCVGSGFCVAAGQVTGANTGVASGITATTTDGGTTWTLGTTPINSGYLNGVYCSSTTTCLSVGSNNSQTSSAGVIYSSTDGGLQWTQINISSSANFLDGITCSSSLCFASGSTPKGGIILSSSNYGSSWTSSSIPADSGSVDQIDCTSINFCISAGTSINPNYGALNLELASPHISSITPASGPISGGTVVNVLGYGFFNVFSVNFGSNPTTSFNVVSSGDIQIVSPSSTTSSPSPIFVNTPGGSSNPAIFQYQNNITYIPVNPTRICDTRQPNGTNVSSNQCNGGLASPGSMSPGSTMNISVVGSFSTSAGTLTVPVTATSVVLNVTVTDTTQPGGFLTIYPNGSAQPNSSNLNFNAGSTVANLVQVGVGIDGSVSIYNFNGTTDVIVDLEGYFIPTTSTSSAGQYVPINPIRVCDTRGTNGTSTVANQCNNGSSISNPIQPNSALTLNVAGSGSGGSLDGIPAGVSAVVLNVTATDTTQPGGFFTVYPSNISTPNASNLNFHQGMSVANRVIVPVDSNGDISVYNFSGTTDAIVDVNGYFLGSGTPSTGSRFSPIIPTRICDSRQINPPNVVQNQCNTPPNTTMIQNSTLTINVAGSGTGGAQDFIPSTATAIVLNVTVTDTTSDGGFITVYPTPSSGNSVPNVSDLNWSAGQTVANSVVVKIGAGDAINIYNAVGSTDIIVDVMGYYY